MSRRLTTLAIAAVLGCGEGVHGIAHEAGALLTLEVRVDPAIDNRIERADPNMRAGIVWAALPTFQGYCLSFGVNPLLPGRPVTSSVAQVGCRDPFDVIAGDVDFSVPFDIASGVADVAVTALPGAEVLARGEESVIAYASVVLFDDVDGDGELTLSEQCGGRVSEDRVYASSWSSLRRPQERFVFREGVFDPPDSYYPAPECKGEPPPEGFSIWTLGSVFEERCAVVGVDQHIELARLELAERTLATCGPGPTTRFDPPPPDPPASRMISECIDAETLVVADPDCVCPTVTVFRLSGCKTDFLCTSLEWDFTSEPPEWWSCGAGS